MKNLTTLIILLLLNFSLFSQEVFQSVVGKIGADSCYSIIQKPDGGYLAVGMVEKSAAKALPTSASLIELSEDGNLTKSHFFETADANTISINRAFDILMTSGGEYVILTDAYDIDIMGGVRPNLDIGFIQLNSDLSVARTKRLGSEGDLLFGPIHEQGISIIEAIGGGYYIAGTRIDSSSSGDSLQLPFFLKTDANFDLDWSRKIDDFSFGVVVDIIQDKNNENLIIVGHAEAGTASDHNIFIKRFDRDGSVIWPNHEAIYGKNNNDVATSIIQTSDGGYLVCGAIDINTANSEIIVIKLQPDLSEDWSTLISSPGGFSEYATKVIETSDQNYVLCGQVFAPSPGVNGLSDAFLVKIDNGGGGVLWSQVYGGPGDELANDVFEADDNGLILCGSTNSATDFGANNSDMYIVKTDESGQSGCFENNITFTNLGISITPDIDLGGSDTEILGTPTQDFTLPALANTSLSDSLVCKNRALEIYLPEFEIICQGNAITIGDSVIGGTPPYTFDWIPDYNISDDTAFPTVVSPTVDTTYVIIVTDNAGLKKVDSIFIDIVPNDSSWTGLNNPYCTSSMMSILTPNEPGGWFEGPGVNFNGVDWYFDPAEAGVGTHPITYIACEPNTKMAVINPAPCIESVVKDTSGGAVVQPQGIFTDCDGQIYLTDKTYILRVDTLGVTHRVAGKQDTSGFADGYILDATMDAPIGITIIPNGTIFFVDGGNHAVRMIRNDTVYTVVNAGGTPGDATNTNGPAAQLRKPYGITYDLLRNCLYVSEAEQTIGQVKKIDLNTPNFWTTDLIGGGGNPISSPQTGANARFDIAKHLSSHEDYIYITDANQHVIYQYDIVSDIIDIYAGQFGAGGISDGPLATASLLNPTGLSVNCSGEMYVAEYTSHLLRRVNDTEISTYYGNPFTCDPAKLCNPSAVSVFVKGFLDIANTGGNDIRRMTIEDWDIAPWVGLDPDDVYCPGEDNDTLKPIYACGGYGPAWLVSDDGSGNWIFDPPSSPGHYRIFYDYQVGYCTQRVYKDLWVSNVPSVDLADSVGICSPDSALLEPNWFWPGTVSFLWSNGDTTMRSYAKITGVYNLTVTNNNGCTASDSTSVVVKPTFNINEGLDRPICFGDVTTLGDNPLTDAIDPIVRWWPAATLSDSTVQNPTAQPLTTTAYYVWVRDKYNCRSVDTVVITVNDLPTVDAGTPGTVCAGDPITVGGSPTATGTVGPYLYSWAPIGTISDPAIANPDASPTATTDYIITVTDGNTCVNSDTVTITANPVPTATATTVDAQICNGGSTQLGVNFSIPAPLPTGFSWTPVGTLSNPGIVNPIASPTDTTEYFVNVTYSNGCSDTSSVTVEVVVPVANVVDANLEVCRGDSVQIQASGGSTYDWLPVLGLSDPTIANPWAMPVNTTAYTLTVSIPGGCTDDTVVNVTVLDLPIPAVTFTDSSICNGETIVLEASGAGAGGSYEWLPDIDITSRFTATPSVNPTSDQSYTAAVIDAQGCRDYATVNVTVDSLPVATATSNSPVCEGSAINLTGGPNPMIDFQWTGPNSYTASVQNPSIAISTPTMQGTYTLVVTDVNGCVDSETTDVIVTTLSAAVSNDGPVCEGDAISLTSSPNGMAFYNWDGPGALTSAVQNPVLNPSTLAMTGKWTVTISDGTCIDTASTFVDVLPIPSANVSFGSTTICYGDSVQLVASGGTVYTWVPATDISATDIAAPIVYPASNTTYTVTVSNGTCDDDTSVNITVNLIDISVDNPITYICENSSVTLDVTGAAALLYSWTPSTYLNNANLQSPTATNAVTNVSYTVRGMDGFGCYDEDTLYLAASLNLSAYAGEDDIICKDLQVMLGGTGPPFALTAEGGIAPYSYSWLPTAGLDDPVSDNPMATIDSSIRYIVTITDLGNCTDEDTIDIQMLALPTADAGLDDTICYSYSDIIGGLVTASGTVAPYVISWSPAAGLDSVNAANPIASPTQTTEYIVLVTDANSCENRDTMEMYVLAERGVNPGDSSICIGDTIQLIAQGGTSYFWSPSTYLDATNISDPISVPDTNISYVVVVSSNFCTDSSFTANVTVNPLPTIISGPDTTIFQGQYIDLYASGGVTYLWSPVDDIIGAEDISDPQARPLQSTDFIVEVTNQYECISWDTVSIIVDEDTKEIFIPEAFTPNNDDLNDEICIRNIGYNEFDFKVFNRWGEMIFSTTDPGTCWDGTVKGEIPHMQTFGYILKYTDFDGNGFKQTGTITILK